jgi:hypothetical protein
MNNIPGIYTVESCCGHDATKYHIWFRAKRLKYLPRLLYYFDGCHCGYYGWRIIAKTDCGMSPVFFLVEGPIGEEAYKQANHIAELLEMEIDNNERR